MKRCIATHNSATGEKSKTFLHCLLIPFARTQSKSLAEQYKCGCRYFDLRARKINGTYYCAHGLWVSKMTLQSALETINSFATENVYVMISYEGTMKYPIAEAKEFLNTIENYCHELKRVVITEVNVKKPVWKNLTTAAKAPKYISYYIVLDGRSWHTYIPIPWLWNRIYTRVHEFNFNYYKFVDFL